MKHEPCALLSDTKSAVYFVGANAVLASHQQPQGREPLFQRNRRILEYGSNFERELLPRVRFVAAVHASVCQISDLIRPAFGTAHLAIKPAHGDHELTAILEVA